MKATHLVVLVNEHSRLKEQQNKLLRLNAENHHAILSTNNWSVKVNNQDLKEVTELLLARNAERLSRIEEELAVDNIEID